MTDPNLATFCDVIRYITTKNKKINISHCLKISKKSAKSPEYFEYHLTLYVPDNIIKFTTELGNLYFSFFFSLSSFSILKQCDLKWG